MQNEKIIRWGIVAAVISFCSLFFGLSFVFKSCNSNIKTVAERLPAVAVTDAKQNNEISQLAKQVEQLTEQVSNLSEQVRQIDSLRVQNYIDARNKSKQQHFGEISKRYTKQKAN